MRVIRREQNLKLSGTFDKSTAHQLVLEDCSGLVKGAIFANGDTVHHFTEPVSLNRKRIYAQIDGGGVLITGKSNLVFADCIFRGNSSIMCGGGVSIQASPGSKITFKNCQFVDNRAADTGAAIDLLTSGLDVVLEDCLFDGNFTKRWVTIPRGHISVFPNNQLRLIKCVFKDGDLDVDFHGKALVTVDKANYRIRDVSSLKTPKTFTKAFVVIHAWLRHPVYLPRV